MKRSMSALLILCASTFVHADIMRTNEIEHFDKYIVRRPLAVVLFYSKQHKTGDQLDLLFNAFNAAEEVYKKYVTFITVNSDKNNLLTQRYAIDQTMVPLIMLFKDGKPFEYKGNGVALQGYVSSGDIVSLINDHFKNDIRQIKAQRQQDQLTKAQLRASYGWPFVGPYYWDYWGWPSRAYYPFYYR